MKADTAVTMPALSHKANYLRLSLTDVRESEDEEAAMLDLVKRVNGVTVLSPLSSHRENDDGQERLQTIKLKRRTQSAKHPHQNGISEACSDSPSSTKGSTPPCRLVPPKSAPNLSQRRNSKTRTVKSRAKSAVEEYSEPKVTSPTSRRKSDTTVTGLQRNGRPARRRFPSRSDDLSSSSGDPFSPRLSVSERRQHSPNGTSSIDGSDDVRQSSVPSSPGAGKTSGQPAPPPSAWDFFEEHVRLIHDSSDMFSRYQGPSFQSSSTFQETMKKIYGITDYTRKPTTSIKNVAAHGMMVAGAASRFLKLRKSSTLASGQLVAPAKERVVDKQTAENAKRGWRVLKQYVQDNFMSKRTSQAALSWSMLRHTLKGLSDKEKTRLDLYRRYGVIPTVDGDGNMVTVNTMLSERARQAIANGSRHPLLAHASKTQSIDKLLPSSPSSAALSSSSAFTSRDTTGVARSARSSVERGSRAEVRPHTSLPRTRLGSGVVPPRTGVVHKKTEPKLKSANR